MFLFERQNAKPIYNPSTKMLARQLRYLQSTGKSSFASLTDKEGNWIQVGGGKLTCVLERKDYKTGQIYRAWQKDSILPKDFNQAILSFGAGNCLLALGEWFQIDQVIDVFTAFMLQSSFPTYVKWRNINTALYFDNKLLQT